MASVKAKEKRRIGKEKAKKPGRSQSKTKEKQRRERVETRRTRNEEENWQQADTSRSCTDQMFAG
jgi:hypothetical protein